MFLLLNWFLKGGLVQFWISNCGLRIYAGMVISLLDEKYCRDLVNHEAHEQFLCLWR